MKLFTKQDAAGNELPDDSTSHVILIDHKLQLMIDVRDELECEHYEIDKKVAAIDLLGHKDWRAPTPIEMFSQLDHSVYPAHNKSLYPNVKPKRYWTSQVDPVNSGFAFAVYCDSGYASCYDRYVVGVVRAVRSLAPSPGQ